MSAFAGYWSRQGTIVEKGRDDMGATTATTSLINYNRTDSWLMTLSDEEFHEVLEVIRSMRNYVSRCHGVISAVAVDEYVHRLTDGDTPEEALAAARMAAIDVAITTSARKAKPGVRIKNGKPTATGMLEIYHRRVLDAPTKCEVTYEDL